VPILSGGPLYKDRSKPIEDYTSSFGERAGAILEAGRDNSFLGFLSAGVNTVLGGNPLEAAQAGGRMVGLDVAAELDPANRVNAADARKAAEKRGVKLDIADDAYFSPGELQTVLYFKERERKQQAIRSRRPKTWGGFATEVGIGLAATFQDPVQVAANFIPVVPAARYAAWIERAGSAGGRAAVRAGVGAAEGLAGAAVLEPFFYGQAKSLNLDYTAQDSFLNLAFGTVLGGGLHALGGAVYDRATGAYREVPDAKSRAALLKAITALDAGRELDVNTILRDGRARGSGPTVNPAAESAALDLNVYGNRIFYRGVKADRAEVISVSDRGPLGAGVYLSEVEGVARMYGDKITAARVKGEVFNGLARHAEGAALVEDFKSRVLPLLTEKEAARFEQMTPSKTSSPSDMIDGLSRTVDPERMREIMQKAGYAGIESNVDGHEIVVFDPANIIKEDDYQRALREASAPTKEPSIAPDTYDPTTGIEPPEMEALRMEAEKAARAPEAAEIDSELEALNEMLDAGRARGTLDAADEKELAAVAAIDSYAAKAVRATKAAASCIIGVA